MTESISHSLSVVLEREDRIDNSCKYSWTTERCGSTDSDQRSPKRIHKKKSTAQWTPKTKELETGWDVIQDKTR